MVVLDASNTWDLIPLPPNKPTVKGYTHIFGLGYSDTFSPMAKMTFVRLFLAMVTI